MIFFSSWTGLEVAIQQEEAARLERSDSDFLRGSNWHPGGFKSFREEIIANNFCSSAQIRQVHWKQNDKINLSAFSSKKHLRKRFSFKS